MIDATTGTEAYVMAPVVQAALAAKYVAEQQAQQAAAVARSRRTADAKEGAYVAWHHMEAACHRLAFVAQVEGYSYLVRDAAKDAAWARCRADMARPEGRVHA